MRVLILFYFIYVADYVELSILPELLNTEQRASKGFLTNMLLIVMNVHLAWQCRFWRGATRVSVLKTD